MKNYPRYTVETESASPATEKTFTDPRTAEIYARMHPTAYKVTTWHWGVLGSTITARIDV